MAAAAVCAATASADQISNNVDASVDATFETVSLAANGATRSVGYAVNATNGDGKNGCNLTGGTILVVAVNTSNAAAATVSPTSLTFNSCGDTPTITVTPHSAGSANITLTQTTNTTGATFDLAPASFTVNVTAPPNTPPTVSVTGVTNGGDYVKGAVPGSGCSVSDTEDGLTNSTSAATKTTSAISGPYAADGIGAQTVTCSYTDAGGLTTVASATYTIKDPTAPTIGYTLVPSVADGANGWFKSDVSLTWSVADPDTPSSLVLTGCASQTITADQSKTTYSCSATSAGGSAGPTSVVIGRDAAMPTVAFDAALPTSTSAATINLVGSASDATSGVSSVAIDGSTSGVGFNPVTGFSKLVSLACGPNTFAAVSTDAAGNSSGAASVTITRVCDTTPPVVSKTITGTEGAAGWYTSDVTVAWTVTDPDSAVTIDSGCGTQDFTANTASAESACTAHSAGGSASDSITLKIDKSAPSVSVVSAKTADDSDYVAGTWSNQDVTVTFACSDNGPAGVGSFGPNPVTKGEGENQTASTDCVDNAGNSANGSLADIDVDKTAPSAVTALVRPADHNGWYNAPVGWQTSGTDALSGIASCSSGIYSGPDGTGRTVGGSCTDNAGNSASDAASFDYDNTDPEGVATALEHGPDHNGWYNAPVDWHTSGTDATSDIASCSSGTYNGPDGAVLTVSGSCTDNAGNESAAAASTSFDYDDTDPSGVTTALAHGPDHNGWYNAAVDWQTTGDDATSGIDSCSSGTYNGPDGTGRSVNGSCTDKAGNSASDAVSFDYDAGAPTAATTLLRPADHNGWYNASVDWHTTGTDGTSGIATCSSGTYDGPDGTGRSVNGSCTDNAGNHSESASSAAFDYDNTDPVAAATALEHGPDHNGWYNGPVDWHTSGTDATSGIDTCSSGTYNGPDGTARSVSGSCTDQAGNHSGVATSSAFDYDNTNPALSPTVTPNPVLLNGSATAAANATDSLSGVASQSCAAVLTGSPGAKSLSCSATDAAGNSATATTTYSVVYATGASCAGSAGHAILQPINPDGTSVFKQGSTVPAKFRVCDAGGNSIGTPGVVTTFKNVKTVNGTIVSTIDEDVYSTTPDTTFRWDPSAQQWIFNITTKPLKANTTYYYEITLNDGTKISFNFGLK